MKGTILQSLLGIITFIAIAWLASENRRRFPLRTALVAVVMQLALGFLLLKVELVQSAVTSLNGVVLAVEEATRAGTSVVFGYLGGSELPFAQTSPGSTFILAFKALPIILVISALSSLLFYWRILPFIIRALARMLERTLGVGGAEGLGLAANIFVGMVEAPLLIRPYLLKLSRAELFAVMCCGMATVAGTVIVLYASILGDRVPDALGHILVASVISVPAAFLISRIMIPHDGTPTDADAALTDDASSAMEAVTEGTVRGVRLLVNIAALLIVMVALVALIDIILALVPARGGEPLSLQWIFGYCFAPLAWLIGVPWGEALAAGELLGTKTVVNEFVAYLSLAKIPEETLSAASAMVLTYAMCGFANPGSLGIMIGGLSAMVPERRAEIIDLGIRSVVAGTLATFMTGAVANILFSV